MHRRTALFVLALGSAAPVAAQQATLLAAGLPGAESPAAVTRALHAAMLKPAYQVKLVSDWPQLSAGGVGCVNGGQEVLEGKLVQTSSGDYTGQLVRKGTIRFCGVHAGVAEVCALTLTSAGTVTARGAVAPIGNGWTSPVVTLRWSSPEGSSEAVVEGDCSAQFNEAVRRLYLSVSHSVEFLLPTADQGPSTVRLDDFGWIVDVR